MPRPFAIIGLMVFFVLAVLYNASSMTVLTAFLSFVLLLLLSIIIKKFRKENGIHCLLAAGATACLLLLCLNEFWYVPQTEIADSEHSSVILITSEPERKYGNYYYEAKATEIDGKKTNMKLRVSFFSKPDLSPYDEIEGNFYYYRLGASSDSLMSSYKADNMFLGVYPAENVYNISKTNSHFLGKLVISLRSGIKNGIMTVLPNDYGALSVALVLGDRSCMSDETYSVLKNAGITHIICVSGLHLSLWSSAVLWLIKKLKIKEKYACLLTVPAVLFIMVLTGMTYSVIRAGIMMIIYLVSKVLSQRSDSLNSLGVSVLAIVCINPFAAGSVSFQLSVLATLGVILCNEFVMPKINDYAEKHSSFIYIEKPVKLLLITAGAVIFTMPVTLTVYRCFSLAVFPSNLIIVGIAEACMMLSATGALVAFISTSIINIPAFIAGILAKVIIKIASIIGGTDFVSAYISERDAYFILGFVFVVAAIFFMIYSMGYKRAIFAFILIPIVFIINVFTFSYIDSLQTVIRVLDIEGGRNVLVSYKNENILLGCSGDDSNGLYKIEDNALKRGGSLDSIIVADGKNINTGYLKNIMTKCNTSSVYCKDADYSTMILASQRLKSDLPECSTENIHVVSVKDENGNEAFVIETPEMKAVVFYDEIDSSTIDYDISDCDVVVICGDTIPSCRFVSLSSVIVCDDGEAGVLKQKALISSGINASVTAGYGDVTAYGYRNRITIERG